MKSAAYGQNFTKAGFNHEDRTANCMTDYSPPCANESRALLRAFNLTGSAAAKLAGLANGRMVRRYTSEAAYTPMPFAVLFTLCARGGGVQVTPAGWRDELAAALATAAED